MAKEYLSHQFNLYGYVKPTGKVPISAARIREAKEALIRGDSLTAIQSMRDIREKLENYEKRINHKPE